MNKTWCAVLFDLAWFEWFERVVIQELDEIPGADFCVFDSSKSKATTSRELEVYIDVDASVSPAYASDSEYDSDASDYDEVEANLGMIDRLIEDIMDEIEQILDKHHIEHDVSESPMWSSSQIDLKIDLPYNPYDLSDVISNLDDFTIGHE